MKPIPVSVFASKNLGELVRHPRVRPEHAAIWIARDAHPQLTPAQVVHELDSLAQDFEVEEPDDLDPYEQATSLLQHLALRHCFKGNRDEYYDAENSYLDSVLKRRQGIPISLAVVYIAVGDRVGIPVFPLGFPGHFLIRVGAPQGVIVDPFEGRILQSTELPVLLSRALGAGSALKPEHLAEVDVAQMAQRMLLNLKRIHEARREHARSFLVTDRLVELGTSPELRRDRGLLALKLGAHQVAATDLAHYLLKRPNATDAKEIRNALSKARKDAPLAN